MLELGGPLTEIHCEQGGSDGKPIAGALVNGPFGGSVWQSQCVKLLLHPLILEGQAVQSVCELVSYVSDDQKVMMLVSAKETHAKRRMNP